MSFMEQYLVQLGDLGERCKLPQRGMGQSPSGNQTWCILAWKSDIFWHQFFVFPDFSKKTIFPWPLKFPDFFQFSLTCRNPVYYYDYNYSASENHGANAAAASMSTRQIGHRRLCASHWSTHEIWNRCMQARRLQHTDTQTPLPTRRQHNHLYIGDHIWKTVRRSPQIARFLLAPPIATKTRHWLWTCTSSRRILAEFSDKTGKGKDWALNRKIRESKSTDQKHESGRPKHARTEDIVTRPLWMNW